MTWSSLLVVPAGVALLAAPASGSSPASAEPSAEAPAPSDEAWIHRYPPVGGSFELGAFGGAWFPSERLELFDPDRSLPNDGHRPLRRVAPELGLRAGYYPLRLLGVEVEGAVLPTRTLDGQSRATAWALRGNVVGQLGLWSVTPFVLVGVGVMGIVSADTPIGLGRDQDFDLHFGGGVKVSVYRGIQLRLDVRDVLTNQLGIGDGVTSSPELLLGVTWVLGRRRVEPAPPRSRPSPAPTPTAKIDDDLDDDTLLDPVDQCVSEPETFNDFEDDDGCPDEIPPELAQVVGIIEGIYFDNDEDVIKPQSRPVLDRAVEVLGRFPRIHVIITGHTSSPGTYLHNIDLSRRRARAVKRYLVEHGIESGRLSTSGVGPDQPIDTNFTMEGRARNRRIEFTIIDAG